MENQTTEPPINRPEQETQPSNTPAKHTVNIWMVVSTILGVCLLATGAYAYSLSTKMQSLPDPAAPSLAKPIETTPTSPQQAPSDISITQTLSPTTTNQNLITYDNKYISFQYPNDLYKWSWGRGVSLDYFQINSVPDTKADSRNIVHISFDIQFPGYTTSQTIQERKLNEEEMQRKYPQNNYIISDRTVDAQPAIVTERSQPEDDLNPPSYSKEVWLMNNDVKYIIRIIVKGDTLQQKDMLISQYSPIFEEILDSVELKHVDSAEVENIRNSYPY